MAKLKKPPTLKDVARIAGVTGQTVSNYMTGRNKPRGENLARIEKAIEKLNYRPSAAARALRLKKSNMIAVLLEDSIEVSSEGIGEGWGTLNSLFLKGATIRAREHGFYVTAALSSHGDIEEHVQRISSEGRADGLICSTGSLTDKRLDKLDAMAHQVPIVLLQETRSRPQLATVSAEDEHGITLAVQHLKEKGHKRLAMVTTKPQWPGPMRRVKAAMRAAARLGLRMDVWVANQYSTDAIRRTVASQLSQRGRPTGILAINDIVAVAIIQQAMELRLRVPEDCSVIGFNNFEISSYFRPAVTTIETPAIAMGARAVDIVVGKLNGEKKIGSASLPIRFIARESSSVAP